MNEYELSNEITVITNATRDLLLDKNTDALVLYLFYIKGTNHQKTNSIWITDEFAMKGLKWGRDRVVKAKNFLVDNNLIELKKQRFENGTYGKTYVVVKYLWKQENKDLLIERDCIQLYQNPKVDNTEGGKQTTNALSNYKLNALSNKKEMLEVSDLKNKDLFEDLPFVKELEKDKKEKPYSSQNFLLSLDNETLEEFENKFKCNREQIKNKAEQLFEWCETNGKRKKNYKMFLSQALRKDYGVKEKLLCYQDDPKEFMLRMEVRNQMLLDATMGVKKTDSEYLEMLEDLRKKGLPKYEL